MNDLYIGLMSGTSADGIDVALVDFSCNPPKMVASHYAAYSSDLREKIISLCKASDDEIKRMGELDQILGKTFAQAIKKLLNDSTHSAADIKAIGSHGQTIRHHPNAPHYFTLQIGDPNTIAAETGITTVADFRRRDVALGGQGAPLVPAFHQHLFASDETNRIIVNIGGIANITLLPKKHPNPVLGFDTGPGNILLDNWIQKHQQKTYDSKGEWAAQGKLDNDLLAVLLSDTYFQQAAPKSTGREYFHLEWLQTYLNRFENIPAVHVQRTLIELTAKSILLAIEAYLSQGEIIVCGGGTQNTFLMSRLRELAKPNFTVETTKNYGIDPDWVEAIAFAWLARQTLNRQPGNLPSVTGASQAAILGGIYLGMI